MAGTLAELAGKVDGNIGKIGGNIMAKVVAWDDAGEIGGNILAKLAAGVKK